MPTYEYKCKDCDKSFTVEQSVKEHSESQTPKCPKCKKSKSVERQLSPAFVQTSKKS